MDASHQGPHIDYLWVRVHVALHICLRQQQWCSDPTGADHQCQHRHLNVYASQTPYRANRVIVATVANRHTTPFFCNTGQ
jgi:hypothetical protein